MSEHEVERTGRPPLFVIKEEATAEEVAAVTAALTAVASAAAPPAEPPRSTWASPRGRMRPAIHPGAGAWRKSFLPR